MAPGRRSRRATRSSTPTSGPTGHASSPTRSPIRRSTGSTDARPIGRDAPSDLLVVTMTAYEAGLPGPGRLPAGGGSLARPGLLGGRLAPVPRRRDREVRPRDVLLQRRRRGAVSGRGAVLVPSPKVATYDLAPEMSAVGVTDALVEAIGVGSVRLHRGELRERGHGRPHRVVGRDDRGARDHRRAAWPGSSTRSRPSTRTIPARRARCSRSPPTTATPTACATRTATPSRRTRSTRSRSSWSVERPPACASPTASWPTSRPTLLSFTDIAAVAGHDRSFALPVVASAAERTGGR